MKKTIKTDLGNKEVFSKNLSRCIKRSDKTQRELAHAIGVHPSTICDWLQERTYPRMDKVQLIAEFFGISKSELVEDNYVAKETVSEEDQEVLDLLHQIPKEKRADAIALCKSVLSTISKF